MNLRHIAIALSGVAVTTGCSEEPRPRSIEEFIDDPIVLEAAVVRCARNRDETRYDAECVNARQAVSILEAREDRERAKILDAQSERKRQALRRTQEAAAEARRRADAAERMRREAEYLAQFGELPLPEDRETGLEDGAGNAPGIVISGSQAAEESEMTRSSTSTTLDPGAAPPDAESAAPRDLREIREGLQRRTEEQPDG